MKEAINLLMLSVALELFVFGQNMFREMYLTRCISSTSDLILITAM